MSHYIGQGEKKEWLKLVYLSNVITWRGFGKKKYKNKKREWRRTNEKRKGKKKKKKKEEEK